MTPQRHLPDQPEEDKHYPRSMPKDADGRVGRLGQRRRLGPVFTDTAALHHTKPLTWNRLRDTNPIVPWPRQRVRSIRLQ